MTGMELLTLGGKAAGKQIFEKFATETLSTIKSNVGAILKKKNKAVALSKLYNHIHKVRLVKTLWQIDKPVDISTFYCQTHVYIKDERKQASSMADFANMGNLLIEGIAGQGKSIFLRYLCGVELVREEYIPIFLELRKLHTPTTLLDYVLSSLEEFGVFLSKEEFKTLSSSGKVLVLLDAFDEVHEEDKPFVVEQLEHFARVNDGVRLVVTSRPNSGLEASSIFQTIKLSDLEKGEYQQVIFKLLEDQKISGELIKQVNSHRGGVKELLKTPLLVTLLVINYKSFQIVPAQLSDFYDSLFKLLLLRHDGTKPGYRRKRLCTINDSEYRIVFEAFCYLAKKYKEGILNHSRVYETAREALQTVNAGESADNYINDIVHITCLLVKDGEEYRFIHKSVQEYYAACFVKSKPDTVAKIIYEKLFSTPLHHYWMQELNFLSEIDSYRFLKFGLIPQLGEYLGVDKNKLSTCTDEEAMPAVLKHISEGKVYFNLPDYNTYGLTIPSVPTINILMPLFRMTYKPVFEAIKNGLLKPLKSDFTELKQISPGLSSEDVMLQINSIISAGIMVKDYEVAAREIAKQLTTIFNTGLAKMNKDEKDNIALEALI